MKKKILLAMLAVILIVAMSVAGTLAYLQAKTETPVKNTFVAAGGGKIIDDTGPVDPTDPTVKGLFLVESKVEYKDNNYSAVDPQEYVKENKYEKVAPKMDLFKDPMLTVNIEGEAEVYIFVQVTSTMNDALSFELTDDWTAVTGYDGVYVYKNAVQTGDDSVELDYVPILKDNKVVVADVTTFGTLTDGALGDLSFCAYVCQAGGFADAAAAWAGCFAS